MALEALSRADFVGALEAGKLALEGFTQQITAPGVAFQQLSDDITETSSAIARSQTTFTEFAESTEFVRDRLASISSELAVLKGRLAASQALSSAFGGGEKSSAGVSAIQQRIAALEEEQERIESITAAAQQAGDAIEGMGQRAPEFDALAEATAFFDALRRQATRRRVRLLRLSDAGEQLQTTLGSENEHLTRLRDAYLGVVRASSRLSGRLTLRTW